MKNPLKTLFLVTLLATAGGCSEEPVVPDDYGLADFEQLWTITNQYYPFFDFKKIDWDSIHDVYHSRFTGVTESEKIQLLGELLNELRDGHANLFDEQENCLSYYTPRRSLKDQYAFSQELIASYFPEDLMAGEEYFRYGTGNGNIGYIYIASFPREASNYSLFDEAIEYLKDTEGLILDIRHNGGGSTNASDYFISRILAERLEGTLWTRRGGGYFPLKYYDPAGDFQYTNPVVLLINGKSFSTAEAMANLCKKIEHVTLVGDTTGGGGGVPDEVFGLPSGLKFRVPTRCTMRYDGEHVEWNGIPPDVLLPQTLEDIENEEDLQLEYAFFYLTLEK